jgi:hypothetical protein
MLCNDRIEMFARAKQSHLAFSAPATHEYLMRINPQKAAFPWVFRIPMIVIALQYCTEDPGFIRNM